MTIRRSRWHVNGEQRTIDEVNKIKRKASPSAEQSRSSWKLITLEKSDQKLCFVYPSEMCKPTGPSSAAKGCFLSNGKDADKLTVSATSFWKSKPILIERKIQQKGQAAGSYCSTEKHLFY